MELCLKNAPQHKIKSDQTSWAQPRQPRSARGVAASKTPCNSLNPPLPLTPFDHHQAIDHSIVVRGCWWIQNYSISTLLPSPEQCCNEAAGFQLLTYLDKPSTPVHCLRTRPLWFLANTMPDTSSQPAGHGAWGPHDLVIAPTPKHAIMGRPAN